MGCSLKTSKIKHKRLSNGRDLCFSDWGDIDEQACFAILSAAVDAGVNFFDTADVYGGGRSESLIGRFLKQTGHEIFVATKLGRTGK